MNNVVVGSQLQMSNNNAMTWRSTAGGAESIFTGLTSGDNTQLRNPVNGGDLYVGTSGKATAITAKAAGNVLVNSANFQTNGNVSVFGTLTASNTVYVYAAGQTNTGTIAASAFVGDGSGLTGIVAGASTNAYATIPGSGIAVTTNSTDLTYQPNVTGTLLTLLTNALSSLTFNSVDYPGLILNSLTGAQRDSLETEAAGGLFWNTSSNRLQVATAVDTWQTVAFLDDIPASTTPSIDAVLTAGSDADGQSLTGLEEISAARLMMTGAAESNNISGALNVAGNLSAGSFSADTITTGTVAPARMATNAATDTYVLTATSASTAAWKAPTASSGGGGGTNSGPIELYALGNQVNIPLACPLGVVTNSLLTFRLTLTNNFTITNATGMADGQAFEIEVQQDGTGSRTITWWGAFTNATGYGSNSYSANLTAPYISPNPYSISTLKWKYRAGVPMWMLRANDWGN
jgi:hypothetical protein